MEKTVSGLVALLHEEADIFETLLEILKKENQALIHINVETLHRLAKEKETLSLKGRMCEETRQHLLEKMRDALRLQGDTALNFSVLIDRIPEHLRPALLQARNRLLKVAEEIVLMNCQNGALVQDSLRLIESSLNLIREAAGTVTYQRRGTFSKPAELNEPVGFSAKV